MQYKLRKKTGGSEKNTELLKFYSEFEKEINVIKLTTMGSVMNNFKLNS